MHSAMACHFSVGDIVVFHGSQPAKLHLWEEGIVINIDDEAGTATLRLPDVIEEPVRSAKKKKGSPNVPYELEVPLDHLRPGSIIQQLGKAGRQAADAAEAAPLSNDKEHLKQIAKFKAYGNVTSRLFAVKYRVNPTTFGKEPQYTSAVGMARSPDAEHQFDLRVEHTTFCLFEAALLKDTPEENMWKVGAYTAARTALTKLNDADKLRYEKENKLLTKTWCPFQLLPNATVGWANMEQLQAMGDADCKLLVKDIVTPILNKVEAGRKRTREAAKLSNTTLEDEKKSAAHIQALLARRACEQLNMTQRGRPGGGYRWLPVTPHFTALPFDCPGMVTSHTPFGTGTRMARHLIVLDYAVPEEEGGPPADWHSVLRRRIPSVVLKQSDGSYHSMEWSSVRGYSPPSSSSSSAAVPFSKKLGGKSDEAVVVDDAVLDSSGEAIAAAGMGAGAGSSSSSSAAASSSSSSSAAAVAAGPVMSRQYNSSSSKRKKKSKDGKGSSVAEPDSIWSADELVWQSHLNLCLYRGLPVVWLPVKDAKVADESALGWHAAGADDSAPCIGRSAPTSVDYPQASYGPGSAGWARAAARLALLDGILDRLQQGQTLEQALGSLPSSAAAGMVAPIAVVPAAAAAAAATLGGGPPAGGDEAEWAATGAGAGAGGGRSVVTKAQQPAAVSSSSSSSSSAAAAAASAAGAADAGQLSRNKSNNSSPDGASPSRGAAAAAAAAANTSSDASSDDEDGSLQETQPVSSPSQHGRGKGAAAAEVVGEDGDAYAGYGDYDGGLVADRDALQAGDKPIAAAAAAASGGGAASAAAVMAAPSPPLSPIAFTGSAAVENHINSFVAAAPAPASAPAAAAASASSFSSAAAALLFAPAPVSSIVKKESALLRIVTSLGAPSVAVVSASSSSPSSSSSAAAAGVGAAPEILPDVACDRDGYRYPEGATCCAFCRGKRGETLLCDLPPEEVANLRQVAANPHRFALRMVLVPPRFCYGCAMKLPAVAPAAADGAPSAATASKPAVARCCNRCGAEIVRPIAILAASVAEAAVHHGGVHLVSSSASS